MGKIDITGSIINKNYNHDYYEKIFKESSTNNNSDNGDFAIVLDNLGNVINTNNDFIIESISPLSLYGYEHSMALFLLAKVKSGKLFTLMSIYETENEEEEKFIKECIPFYNDGSTNGDSLFRKLVDNTIIDTLPIYLSDFNIMTEDGQLNNNTKRFYMKAKRLINNKEFENRFYLSPNIAISLLFIENYILEGIKNNHDITLATTFGHRVIDEVSIFNVGKVDSIVSLAPIDKKNNVAIMFKMIQCTPEGNKESLYLLSAYHTSCKLDKKKITTTIESMNEQYLHDANQYISDFFFNTNINGNGYTIHCAKNINNNYKIFILDSATSTYLTHLVATL